MRLALDLDALDAPRRGCQRLKARPQGRPKPSRQNGRRRGAG